MIAECTSWIARDMRKLFSNLSEGAPSHNPLLEGGGVGITGTVLDLFGWSSVNIVSYTLLKIFQFFFSHSRFTAILVECGT